jgi:phage terminase large subunit-like protein
MAVQLESDLQVLQQVVDSDPAEWLEKHFWIEDPRDPNTGEQLEPGPIILAPHQKRVLRAALTKVNGLFPYTTIVYSTIKKSGKTRIAAGVASWFAHTQGSYNEVYCMANDGKQSSDRILSAVRKSVDLNPEINYRRRADKVWIPNGTFIEAIPCDPTGQAGSNPGLTVWSELWGYRHEHKERLWCYDEETKILTRRGWIYGKDLVPGDVVATVRPGSHVLEWEQTNYIFKEEYAGKMHLYENRNFSECVTPEHRLYGLFSPRDKASSSVYEGVLESSKLRRHGGYNTYYPLTSISDYVYEESPGGVDVGGTRNTPAHTIPWRDWCEYAGWYLSEGYIRHNKRRDGTYFPTAAMISQDKNVHPSEYKQIEALHERLWPGRWKTMHQGTSIVIFNTKFARIVEDALGYRLENKRIPDNIKNTNRKCLQVFFDAFVGGDGHILDSGSIEIGVGSRELAGDLLEVAFRLGYGVSIKEMVPKSGGRNHYWRLHITPANSDEYGHELSKYRNHWKEVDYNGVVWCPSTENGLVVVSRKGKVYVSGNTEMTVPPTRYGKAFRWVESYAGYENESQVLEQLYQIGVKNGVRHPLFPNIPVYVNSSARMFVYWDEGVEARRMPWQTEQYYQEERQVLVDAEFQRIHMNKWVTSTEKAFQIEWWDRLQEELPPLDRKTPVVLGVDASVSHDSSGIVVVSRHPDRPNETAVRAVREFVPRAGHKIDYSQTIEPAIMEFWNNYNVIEIPYDEYQLHHMMTNLRRKGLPVRRFNQASKRSLADKQLFDKVIRKEITHNGDIRLRKHVDNAATKTSNEKFRFVKIDTGTSRGATAKPIDLLICLSMADFECSRLNL